MISTIERDQVQKYIVNTVRVTPMLYNGMASPNRYETIILYTGRYHSPLDGRFHTCSTLDEALIKHHEFLHLVVERLAFLERT